MQASPLREKLGEGELLPRGPHQQRRICPGGPPTAIPGVAGGHSEWQPSEPPGRGARVVFMGCCSPPHPPSPPSNPLQPCLAGRRPDEWEPGKGTAQRPAGARSHRPQCLQFSTPPPPALGLSAGKARGGGGDPKSPPPKQATPWHPWVGGWGTLRESRSFPVTLPVCVRSPTSGSREGRVAARSPHFGPLCFLWPPFGG